MREAESRYGGIDVLVNNAGYGYTAAIEEGKDDAVAELFATNFTDPVALMKAVHALAGCRAHARAEQDDINRHEQPTLSTDATRASSDRQHAGPAGQFDLNGTNNEAGQTVN